MDIWQEFHGPNAGYILELYERYQQDPASVDAATRAAFANWSPPAEAEAGVNGLGKTAVSPSPTQAVFPTEKLTAAVRLVQAIREYGHLAADIDPLGAPRPGDPSLELATHGLSEADLQQLPATILTGPAAVRASNAAQAIARLRTIYTGSIGYDYDHLSNPDEREWLREAAESRRFHPDNAPTDLRLLLERLTEVETFEHFLHRVFPGKTRFSIEGVDMMVPILEVIIGRAANEGIHRILVGMAHRGRLNVLTHILNKPYAHILAEFKDQESDSYTVRDSLGWTGDVKYHAGARRSVAKRGELIDLVVTMAPNPSHLEHVNPVVEGMARAAGTFVDKPGHPRFDHAITIPILIHGDAAFAAQGVVAETLNMHRLRGYRVGGTIHLITNNQIGFTTFDWAARSTRYASDLAKGFKIPIVHVNADDPEACIEVARLAFAYRHRFLKDFMIDLVGYRRYGHNEGDEPRFTQPTMYQTIDKLPTVRQKWATTLQQRGLIDGNRAQALLERQMKILEEAFEAPPPDDEETELVTPPPKGAASRVETAVSAAKLKELNRALHALPTGFNLNSKLKRVLDRRLDANGDDHDAPTVDWATAEALALASILADGTAIRFTGEDVERGTFSHRHALLRDAESGKVYVPLQEIPQVRAAFEIRNSPLSENAALGYEYGYNIQAPDRLVIWEGQYGDFINGAQAMLDEFVHSGRAKWNQLPSLVMLLPHGYEGQGPDHSTGRLERFLQSAGETNMRIANPTTAAQYFHLLRRQAALLEVDPLPLIIMSPKSLLRHREAYSSLNELANGRFQPVLDDPIASQNPDKVRRLIFCTGKVYVDLVTSNYRTQTPEVAIVRTEQIYPFPGQQVQPLLAQYGNVEEVFWLQEEPLNMGAWDYTRPRLMRLLDGRLPLDYIGRPRRASPAEGSSTWHRINQNLIVQKAFQLQ